jgi:hypothetical protein
MENDNRKTYIFTTGDWWGRKTKSFLQTEGNKRNYTEIFSSCLDGTINFHL